MSDRRYHFVDWMKAIGIALIVYGHVAHATTVALTPPIYLKQLGVTLFLFATGFTLARERRNTTEAIVNRMFPIWLFGLPFAALITFIGTIDGTGPALSNFMPFVGGGNVAFDNFPANPSTWYLGTYLHFLLLWGIFLRRVRVRLWMVAVAAAIEIPARALLIEHAGLFVAYMLVTNWTAVFLYGLARGAEEPRPVSGGAAPYAIALAGGLVAWGAVMRLAGFTPTFPLMTIAGLPAAESAILVSIATSFLYLSVTALVFEAARRITAPAGVAYVARNSLIVFLVHMPVFHALYPLLVRWGLGYPARVAVNWIVCFVGLTIFSEWIRSAVRADALRRQVVEWMAHSARGELVEPRALGSSFDRLRTSGVTSTAHRNR